MSRLPHPERDAAIFAAARGGRAHVEIARLYGLTAARVGQILRAEAERWGTPVPVRRRATPKAAPNVPVLEYTEVRELVTAHALVALHGQMFVVPGSWRSFERVAPNGVLKLATGVALYAWATAMGLSARRTSRAIVIGPYHFLLYVPPMPHAKAA